MKTSLFIVLLAMTMALPVFAENTVFFSNIKTEYKEFAEIKPTLVNSLNQPIHLQFFYPNGAKLKRLNEETGEWETGGRGIGCATGAKPVEVAIGENLQVELDWEMSTDDFEKPKFFELQDHKTHRPLEGKYKIFMSYALEKWYFDSKPQKIYYVESSEFSIEPKAKSSK